MAEYILKNEEIQIKVDSHGAELRAITDVKSGRDYMWNADPAFWGRVSPVLFPVVGSYKDGESRYEDKVYKMSQHGFARDMEFDLKEQTEDTLWFSLRDNETTKEKYPFAFFLELGYKINGRSVNVLWRVTNPAENDMHFSIGGHPAFLAPLREADKITCYI
ncbi:MAG: aldose 1-epimerase family protein, partial [Lachnospiraceae bacterium]|nr:aldose 1-epimerase family protein [Lachnospiraceae bacterium]